MHQPLLGCLWCLVGPFVPGPSGKKRYDVLGAIDAATHRTVRVTNHASINASSVRNLPREVARAGLPGPVTLVLGDAAYQRCALVQSFAAFLGVELLYSPNPNLKERVWRFVKKEVLAPRVKGDYGEFAKAIDDCLGGLHSNRGGTSSSSSARRGASPWRSASRRRTCPPLERPGRLVTAAGSPVTMRVATAIARPWLSSHAVA